MVVLEKLDLFPLSESWMPPKLLIRDKEFQMLLDNAFSDYPENFWIYGERGLGKTLVANCVAQRVNGTYVIPCISRSFRQSLLEFVLRHGVYGVKSEGPFIMFRKFLDLNQQIERLILFFDDVDRLGGFIKRDFQVFIWSLYDELVKRNIKFSINIISTIDYKELPKMFSAPCLSRLNFKPLRFENYNRFDVCELLRQRLQFIDGLEWDEGAIAVISEYVADMGGDFRKALQLTREAIKTHGKLTHDIIDKVITEAEVDYTIDFLRGMPYYQAMLYVCIAYKTYDIYFKTEFGELPEKGPDEDKAIREALRNVPEDPQQYYPVAYEDVVSIFEKQCERFEKPIPHRKTIYKFVDQLFLMGLIDKFPLPKGHDYNYLGRRALFLKLKDSLHNIIIASRRINWYDEW